MKTWLERAVSICKIAESDDLLAKKSLCLEIFGSNLFVTNKSVVVNDDQFLNSPQENIWPALRAAKEKAARQGDDSVICSDLVRKAGIEPARIIHPRDFKSLASTYSATRANNICTKLDVNKCYFNYNTQGADLTSSQT